MVLLAFHSMCSEVGVFLLIDRNAATMPDPIREPADVISVATEVWLKQIDGFSEAGCLPT